jgi:hypothetical protein
MCTIHWESGIFIGTMESRSHWNIRTGEVVVPLEPGKVDVSGSPLEAVVAVEVEVSGTSVPLEPGKGGVSGNQALGS